MRHHLLAAAALLTAPPALAADFTAVSDRAAFLSLIDGKQLLLSTWNVALTVKPDGQISGSMMGWDVTGSWVWQDGYFCREMDWSGYPIDYNCQLVEAQGNEALRFTVDKGAGRSAVFALD